MISRVLQCCRLLFLESYRKGKPVLLPIEMFISEQRLKKLQFSIYMNTEMRYSTKCGGPDSNRRIPTETDLESVAFNLARQPPP